MLGRQGRTVLCYACAQRIARRAWPLVGENGAPGVPEIPELSEVDICPVCESDQSIEPRQLEE